MKSELGSNSGARAELKAFVESIERLEEEKATIVGDIKEVYAEASGQGYDTKAMRKIIRMRKQDAKEREAEQALLEVYMHALGMLADTPLGEAAIKAAVRMS